MPGFEYLEWDTETNTYFVKGTNITLGMVFSSLANHSSPEEFFRARPEVTPDCVAEILRFTSDRMIALKRVSTFNEPSGTLPDHQLVETLQ